MHHTYMTVEYVRYIIHIPFTSSYMYTIILWFWSECAAYCTMHIYYCYKVIWTKVIYRRFNTGGTVRCQREAFFFLFSIYADVAMCVCGEAMGCKCSHENAFPNSCTIRDPSILAFIAPALKLKLLYYYMYSTCYACCNVQHFPFSLPLSSSGRLSAPIWLLATVSRSSHLSYVMSSSKSLKKMREKM